jgi:hypothetical protein
MNIVPVNFSTKHRAWLGLFSELLTELRIATADEEMSFDKSESLNTSFIDIIDIW